MPLPTSKPSLADLSLPVRLVLATYLIAVGLGYFSALVQLRVQHASEGRAMPSRQDVEHAFSGTEGKSQMERLLTAPLSEPFNGSGSMAGALLDPAQSSGWSRDVKDTQKKDKLTLEQAEEKVRQKRNGERLVLVEWVKSGANQKAYEDNSYQVPDELASQLKLKDSDPLLTETFLENNVAGKPIVKIQSIIQKRCIRCHREGASGSAGEYPLDSYENIMVYTSPAKSGGMSLPKLAQSTHVHMLGFAVLWCLTGLIVACTGFPTWIRVVIAPWVLIAQVADIACWWLAGDNPRFADAIMVTGGLVGMGLAAQMLMAFWDLFRGTGRVILFLVLILIGLGVARFYVKVVEPRVKNGHSLTSVYRVQQAVSG